MGDVLQAAGRSFEELEQYTLDRMLQLFHERSSFSVTPPRFAATIGVDDEVMGYRLFNRMLQLGAIDEQEDNSVIARKMNGGMPSKYWMISPRVIDIVAARKAEADTRSRPPDRVAGAEKWVRSHPQLSIAFITLIVLTFLVTFVNQFVQLIDWALKTRG